MSHNISLAAMIQAGLIAKDAQLSIEAGGRTHTATLRDDLRLDYTIQGYTIQGYTIQEEPSVCTTDAVNIKVSNESEGVIGLTRLATDDDRTLHAGRQGVGEQPARGWMGGPCCHAVQGLCHGERGCA